MRVIVAFLLGILVTIGGAWIHDNSIAASAKGLVNWDVAGDLTRMTLREAGDQARHGWDKLTAK